VWVSTPNKIITAKPRADRPKPAVRAATTPRGRGTNARGKRGGRSGNAARPKTKTAEQLDQEMADYFGGDSNNATAAPAATAAANGGDADMDDTVLVGTP
jgi:THO complex subunit 4